MINQSENSEKIYTFFGKKNYSIYLEEFIPQQVRINYPYFVEFINVYLNYLSEKQTAHGFINYIIANINVDEITCPVFDSSYEDQFLKDIKFLSAVNKKTIIKYLKQFYESIGSEKAIKFMFNVAMNEDVDIEYPWDSVLRTSAGNWSLDKSIKVHNPINDVNILNLEYGTISGKNSKVTALVEKVILKTSPNGDEYAELFLSEYDPVHPIFDLRLTEEITGVYLDGTTVLLTPYSCITGYTIEDPGFLYQENDDIIIKNTTNSNSIFAVVDSTSSGEIDQIDIIEGGTGYVVGDIITAVGDGLGLKARVSNVDNGSITKIKILSIGYQYKSTPHLIITSVGGSGAVLYPVSNNIGKVKSVKIIKTGVNLATNISASDVKLNTNYKIYRSGNAVLNLSPNHHLTNGTGTTAKIAKINTQTGIVSLQFEVGDDFINSDILTCSETLATGFKIKNISSKAEVSFSVGIVGSYFSKYYNTEGFISGDKKLQDSYFYQKFSYIVTSYINKKYWIDSLKANCHPSGTIVFGYSDYEKIIIPPEFGGSISSSYNDIEWLKFKWQSEVDGTPPIGSVNTTIAKYLDFPIYSLSMYSAEDAENLLADGIEVNKINVKTNYCFGSRISIDYETIIIPPEFGGSIFSSYNDIEWLKFKWQSEVDGTPPIGSVNSTIARYLDFPIYSLSMYSAEDAAELLVDEIEVNKINVKTNFCFGSQIDIHINYETIIIPPEFGGSISSSHNDIEWLKFKWQSEDDGTPPDGSVNSYIARYLAFPIYSLSMYSAEDAENLLADEIEVNKINVKTSYCFGSQIIIT